eukprot:g40839.t1
MSGAGGISVEVVEMASAHLLDVDASGIVVPTCCPTAPCHLTLRPAKVQHLPIYLPPPLPSIQGPKHNFEVPPKNLVYCIHYWGNE